MHSLQLKRTTAALATASKPLAEGARVPQKVMRHFSQLARQADAGQTINVTTMSDEDILALIRR